MSFNDYGNNSNNWDGTLTPQDVVSFLVSIGKTAFELKGDWDFWSENLRVLSGSDIFAPARRLGRTEERYSSEIVVYSAILAAKDFVSPPRSQIQPPLQYAFLDPYYNPMLAEYHKYRNTLRWHTDNIPIYVAIRYGKVGIDWVLDKFGDAVKKRYYDSQHQ